MSKSPFTPEFREMVSKLFLDGESSIELSKKYGVAVYTVRKWALRYKEQGIEAFANQVLWNWIKCYNETNVVTGEEGLLDKRGCHKTDTMYFAFSYPYIDPHKTYKRKVTDQTEQFQYR